MRVAPAPAADSALPGTTLIELIGLQWRRERPDLDLSNFLLSIYFMRLGTVVDRAYGRMCQSRHGVSGSDMRVLFALRRGGRPFVKRPTDLFRALLVTSGAITKKVDRLTALGLVERFPDPDSGSGFLIRLTRKGQQAADDATERVARHSALVPALSQFSAAQRQAGSEFALRTLAALETLGVGDAEPDDAAAAPIFRGRKTPK